MAVNQRGSGQWALRRDRGDRASTDGALHATTRADRDHQGPHQLPLVASGGMMLKNSSAGFGMKPYSKDLRLRVLAAVDAGTPREEVARTFSVSMPTIKRWLKRRRETGDVEPKPIPGRPPRKGAMLKEWLPMHLQANDDLTLEEHRQAFEEEFGQTISTSTVGRAIAGLPQGGWPLKKSHR